MPRRLTLAGPHWRAAMTEEELVEIVATSDAAFDGRGEWKALGRVDRERYAARARESLAALGDAGCYIMPPLPGKMRAIVNDEY